MITARQLQELIAFRTPSESVTSLYLEIDPNDDGATRERRFRGLCRRDARFETLQEDVERIARYLAEEFDPGGCRTLAIFSAKRFGLWRACPLPQPVATRLTLADKPWLAPLSSIADAHHRFGVILADERRARFLEVFMGEVHEHAELAVDAREAAHRAADGPHAYLKHLTDRLDGLARRQGFQRVIVGVSADMALRLVNHLHSALQQSLILDPELGPALDQAAVLGRILACEREARKVKETVLVHKLMDEAAQNSRLVAIGLERTLEAFQRGQVQQLLVRDGFAKLGRVCPGCGFLSLDWPKCFDCRRPTEAVFDLVGELVRRAYDKNCEVVRLMHETPLDNIGRIAARLSHPVTEASAVKKTAQAEEPAPLLPVSPNPLPA